MSRILFYADKVAQWTQIGNLTHFDAPPSYVAKKGKQVRQSLAALEQEIALDADVPLVRLRQVAYLAAISEGNKMKI